jgi:hypothetical protein
MNRRRPDIRYRVDPGDVPADKAARRLHLTPERFVELLPDLLKRGFPAPDPTTGMHDLDAIDLWRKGRHGQLRALTAAPDGPQPMPASKPGMADRFIAHQRTAKERRRRRGTA